MTIQQLTIRNFGSVILYTTDLNPELNVLHCPYGQEVSAAIEALLCSKAQQAVPPQWLQKNTKITAQVVLNSGAYIVCAVPKNGQLVLTAVDCSGEDATDDYRYALSHCWEQDAVESFDGRDKSFPMRLCWYRNYRDDSAPENLSCRTEHLADTKTFRSHLIRYIKGFQPESINSKKAYQITIDGKGKFKVFYPGIPGKVSLSETEEKLFRYICFLNVAEFWNDMEILRDLHHEKKPLLIQNFLEYLDASTDIRGLIARTAKLHRQIIILTLPIADEM